MWYELMMGEVRILFKPIKTAASIKSGFEEEALINQEWEGLGRSPDSTICSPRVPALSRRGGGLMRSNGGREGCRNVAKIMGWVVTGRERHGWPLS